MHRRIFAVDECDDMRMMKALEDRYLRRQVIFQFLIQLAQVHRLDGHHSLFALRILFYCQYSAPNDSK